MLINNIYQGPNARPICSRLCHCGQDEDKWNGRGTSAKFFPTTEHWNFPNSSRYRQKPLLIKINFVKFNPVIFMVYLNLDNKV